MFRVARSCTISLLVAACVLFATAPAAIGAPVPWESLDITFSPSGSGSVLLVAGKLPDSASLPAQVELAVPKGAKILWNGELLGGSPDQDPQAEYSLSTRGGMDVLAFTLNKARMAQSEAEVPAAITQDGSTTNVTLKWVAPNDVPAVTMNVGLPAGAKVAKPIKDASVVAGGGGASYYQRKFTGVKAGQSLEMTFAYTGGSPAANSGAQSLGANAGAGTAAAPQPARTASDSTGLVIVLLLVGVLAVAVVLAVRSKMVGRSIEEASGPTTRAASKSSQRRAKDTEYEGDDQSGAASLEADSPAGSGGFGMKQWATIVVLVVLVGGVAFGMSAAGKPQKTAQTISKTFSSAAPCATSKLPVNADPSTLDARANKAFEVLGTLPSITTVTIYTDNNPRIEIGYCESKLDEQKLRTALAPSGLLQ